MNPILAPAQQKLLQYQRDPVAWVREILGVTEIEDWQEEALEAYARHNRISVRSAHGVGKTTWVDWIILHWLNTRHPAGVGVTGAHFDQLKITTWGGLDGWLRRMPESLRNQWDYTTETLKLKAAPAGPEGNWAVLRTAAKERSQTLAGLHSKNMMFIVDEASGVDDSIFEVVLGALTTAGSKLVLTGNPTQASGFFHKTHHEMRSRWWTRKVSAFEVPRRVSGEWIDDVKAGYGEDSNYYRVRVQGEFPSGDDDGVIPLSLIEAAVDRNVAGLDVRPVWGLDPARYGADRSALCKRQGNVILEPIKTWQGKDGPELAGLVKLEWMGTEESMRPSVVCVDVIGIGASVYDAIKRDPHLTRMGTQIIGVNVAESASAGAAYDRLRDELWFRCADWFKARDCKIVKDEALIGELSTPKFRVLPSGKRKVESKDDLKKRGVRSPDIADALCLTFAQPEAAVRTTMGRGGRHEPQVLVDYDETRWGLFDNNYSDNNNFW